MDTDIQSEVCVFQQQDQRWYLFSDSLIICVMIVSECCDDFFLTILSFMNSRFLWLFIFSSLLEMEVFLISEQCCVQGHDVETQI